MKQQLYLESEKASTLVFIACFTAYTASYVGRINYSAALPAILGAGLFSKPEAGIIGSAFFAVYGFFQIINGFLGDRFSPFKMITAGLFCSTGANILMTMCKSAVSMAAVWGFNGFALSLLWAAILKILANIIADSKRSKACLNICATLPVGTITAYLLASVMTKFFSWRGVFTAAAVILFVSGVFFLSVSLKIRPMLTKREISPELSSGKKSSKAVGGLLPVLLVSGILFLLPADAIHGGIKEGITTWVPTMVSEVYHTSASFSTFITILLPIFNITGAYIITPIYRKWFKNDELKTGVFTISVSLVPLILLLFMENMNAAFSVVLLAVVTTAMHTYNYLIITLVPMRFASVGRTATVTGIMNATAYVGCAASSYGFGLIAEKIGWHASVIVWCVLAVVAAFITLLCTRRWRAFINNSKEATA